jgi:hypothetical protein
MKKYKRTNSDLQNITIKDEVTRIPLKTGVEFTFSGRVGSSCSTTGIRLRRNNIKGTIDKHNKTTET